MTPNTKRTFGLALAILGVAFLLLNAADNVMRWNQISSAVSAISLVLVVVGAGLTRRPRSDRQEQTKR